MSDWNLNEAKLLQSFELTMANGYGVLRKCHHHYHLHSVLFCIATIETETDLSTENNVVTEQLLGD